MPEKPEELPGELPLPKDSKTLFTGGVFLIAVLVALRVASQVAIPLVLASILKLVFQPALRFLEKMKVPPPVAAFVILLALIGGVGMLGMFLSGPAGAWADKLPESFPKLQERFGMVRHSIVAAQKMIGQAETIAHPDATKVMPVAIQGERLSDKIFTGTGAFITGVFTTLMIFYFLMVSGDTFLRRLVELMPRFKDKRQVVDLSQHIEHEMTHYLLTITLINVGVGIMAGIIMHLCGLEDAILWGTLAFLLNYVPFIGPLIAAALFLLAGLLGEGTLSEAVVPAALFLIMHILEGSLITPLLLARRFTVNPVVIILSLVFWYWMWGLPGAILAVPMVTMGKILCDRIERLAPVGHFLER